MSDAANRNAEPRTLSGPARAALRAMTRAHAGL